MPTPTTVLFRRWDNTFAGRFLHRDIDNELVVNVVELVDHAPRLSFGEKLYAALWWELTMQRSAPWLDGDNVTSLAGMHILDLDMQQSMVEFVEATQRERLANRLGGS